MELDDDAPIESTMVKVPNSDDDEISPHAFTGCAWPL